jgi:hypothetical protein
MRVDGVVGDGASPESFGEHGDRLARAFLALDLAPTVVGTAGHVAEVRAERLLLWLERIEEKLRVGRDGNLAAIEGELMSLREELASQQSSLALARLAEDGLRSRFGSAENSFARIRRMGSVLAELRLRLQIERRLALGLTRGLTGAVATRFQLWHATFLHGPHQRPDDAREAKRIGPQRDSSDGAHNQTANRETDKGMG